MMHCRGTGLGAYIPDYTLELIKEHAGHAAVIKKIDKRIQQIPRRKGLQLPCSKMSITNGTMLWSHERESILQIWLFVMIEILDDDDHKDSFEKMMISFLKANVIMEQDYILESELNTLQQHLLNFMDAMVDTFGDLAIGFQIPKLHSFVFHTVSAIKKYGSPKNTNTGHLENAHIALVKIPYQKTNKRDNVNRQLAANVS
ncbi:hypothetical protein HDU79_001139 [Rhizoclosmatium sp. JEL0117]|nr:hypothetical protein HDU79_001139 [Rhizoclosmatium sp. JEL0117]